MFCYVIFVVFLLFHFSISFPHCVSEVGDDVDWFYMYKLPQDKAHLNPKVQTGVAYMYMTSKTYKFGWILSEMGIDESNSMLAQTLGPLYQKKNHEFSFIYNDQPPASNKKFLKYFANQLDQQTGNLTIDPPVFEGGHTKGVLLGDQYTGVWLVHSVPRFPESPDGNNSAYHYPETGMKYGQSLLCVSVDTTTLNEIGHQLNYNEPRVVYYRIPEALAKVIPNIVNIAIANKTETVKPWYRIEYFETLEGRKFTSFAKSSNFNDDLYTGLVSNNLKSDLLVETWINGPGVLDSECRKEYKVYNIEGVKFPLLNISFSSHNDHSKWTIAEAPTAQRIEKPRRHISFLKVLLKTLKHRRNENEQRDDFWICVGDINRAVTQERRGGGTLCTSDSILWKNYKSLVKSVQPCK